MKEFSKAMGAMAPFVAVLSVCIMFIGVKTDFGKMIVFPFLMTGLAWTTAVGFAFRGFQKQKKTQMMHWTYPFTVAIWVVAGLLMFLGGIGYLMK